MINYKLSFVTRKNTKNIDILNFKRIDLIDEFTSQFKNEEQLKLYLMNKGALSKDDLNSKISITYTYREKQKKLSVVYSDINRYLNEEYIYYCLKRLSNRIDFLEKLARHYSLGSDKYNPQGVNVSDIRRYIGDVRANGGHTFESNGLNKAINDLYIKAIYKEASASTGETKINYRGFRDLALFIYKYETHQIENMERIQDVQNGRIPNRPDEWEQTSLFNENYISIVNANVSDDSKKNNSSTTNEEINSTTRKDKTLYSYEEDSFVEELDEDDFDERYIEPAFAPNSEEEATYKKYQEALQAMKPGDKDPYIDFYPWDTYSSDNKKRV